MDDSAAAAEHQREATVDARQEKKAVHCDRCGAQMIESSCEIVCLNCGNRMDCSDLSIYMD